MPAAPRLVQRQGMPVVAQARVAAAPQQPAHCLRLPGARRRCERGLAAHTAARVCVNALRKACKKSFVRALQISMQQDQESHFSGHSQIAVLVLNVVQVSRLQVQYVSRVQTTPVQVTAIFAT